MSLIGSLEDLGLGDILQIINLSKKSGLLSIRSDVGEGRILFVDGMVLLASLKGDPEDLRDLLVERGHIGDQAFAAAAQKVAEGEGAIRDVLEECGSITREKIESLCHEVVERAVGCMFRWNHGDFSFDVTGESDWERSELALTEPVNPQYLAMESVRVSDEKHRDKGLGIDSPDAGLNLELSAHEMFGVAPDGSESGVGSAEENGSDAALESLVFATTERCDSDLEAEAAEGLDDEILILEADSFRNANTDDAPSAMANRIDIIEAGPDVPEAASPAPVVEASSPAAATGDYAHRPLVLIDPDLTVLEWVRGTLRERFRIVHIFQRSQEGLGRIRQYLSRAELPVVLISPRIEGNPLGGISDARDFARRLRKQAPNMPVLWLGEESTLADSDLGDEDRVVFHLSPADRAGDSSEASADERRMFSEAMFSILAAGEEATPSVAPPGMPCVPAEGLERLKIATQMLNEGSNRGEVLPLVIRFASESFQRVAMFMVRGSSVVGMAQAGFEEIGGPDDVEMRAIFIDRDESHWFHEVITSRSSHRGPPENAGDRRLIELLGGPAPAQAYIAPVVSGEQVVAILYADQGDVAGPCPDTTALEVVLQHAGLALDRAVLERALAEIESDFEI